MAGPFPHGHKALVASGYTYLGEGNCKATGCGWKILWYRAPTGQIMPIDRETKEPHWKVCVAAEKFRKKKKKPIPPPEPQGNLFEREPGEEG